MKSYTLQFAFFVSHVTTLRMHVVHVIKLTRKFFILYLLFELNVLRNHVSALQDAVVEECLMDLSISELLRLKHSFQHMEKEGSFQGSFWEKPAVNHAVEDKKTTPKPKPKPKPEDESCPSQNCLKPVAMALTGIPRGYYNHAPQHIHHTWQPQVEEKPSKLTTLFNITITALAFLSFGGYLFCLIVHAIKSKGATYFYPVTTVAPTGVDGGIRKIKIYRRGRRAFKQQQPLRSNYVKS